LGWRRDSYNASIWFLVSTWLRLKFDYNWQLNGSENRDSILPNYKLTTKYSMVKSSVANGKLICDENMQLKQTQFHGNRLADYVERQTWGYTKR